MSLPSPDPLPQLGPRFSAAVLPTIVVAAIGTPIEMTKKSGLGGEGHTYREEMAAPALKAGRAALDSMAEECGGKFERDGLCWLWPRLTTVCAGVD